MLAEFWNCLDLFNCIDTDIDEFEETVASLYEIYDSVPGYIWISSLQLKPVDLNLFMAIASYQIIKEKEEVDVENLLNWVEPSINTRKKIQLEIINGKHNLIQQQLINFKNNQFASIESMVIPETVLKKLLGGSMLVKIKTKFEPKRGQLIMPADIVTENLYYNDDEEQQINMISNALQENEYKRVKHDLEKAGLIPGIIALLAGPPGTGKTSFAYQVAKNTNRPIFKVSFETIKGMFVGESEKNLVEVFKEYKMVNEALEDGKDAIFLFNECDGLLGNRFKSTRNSADAMHQTMQTLLLDQFENFQGILLATINNINFDPAYERRFLFKTILKNPTEQVRRKILANSFKDLSSEMIFKLSKDFELTGANVSNIRKKIIIQKITNPSIALEESIYDMCDKEFAFSKPRRASIGFIQA